MDILEKNDVVGCADPYSIAEDIVEKHIDWKEEEDEIETLASCFGITKEGFLSDESPIEAPYLAYDAEGKAYRLSDEEAEKRVTAFLKKYSRFKKPASRAAMKLETQVDQRVLNTVLKRTARASKSEGLPRLQRKVPLKKMEGSNDDNDPQKDTDTYAWAEKGYYFNECVLWSDVCQNSIGDCYFLAALCSVAYARPFEIQNKAGLRYVYREGYKYLSPWHEIDFYVPKADHDDYRELKNKKGTIQSVVVSEDVLVNKNSNRNYGVCGPKEKKGQIPQTKEDADSCWPAVYEKAFAKFLENTSSDKPNMLGYIDYGSVVMAMKSILHTDNIKNEYLSDMSIDNIKKHALKGYYTPICATISGYTKMENGVEIRYGKAGTRSEYFENWGLYTSHVYSLLGCYSREDKTYVVLRNPHGRNPNTMSNNTNVYQEYWGYSYGVNAEPEYRNVVDIFRELRGDGDHQNSNGLFLLEINEFKRVFDYITYAP